MDFRIAQMQQRIGVDETAARREIRRSDAAHGSVFMRFFGADWADPRNYDLVMNTGRVKPSVCADILCNAIASPALADTEESRAKLLDLWLEERMRSALGDDPRLRKSARHIRVAVEDGSVRLYGLTTDATARNTAEQVVCAQSGVRDVRNEIAFAGRFE
jgi:hypothetical protein